MNYIILTLLIIVGIYDVYLFVVKRPTVSQQYQKFFPTWKDLIFLAIILTSLCFLSSVHPALRIWIAGIAGHICWPNKERYEK